MTARVPVRVAFAKPSIGEEEIAAVAETLRTGWIAAGPRTAALEEKFKDSLQAKHAIAVSSCTGALHIAYTLLGVEGGEVILPTLTFAATALSAIHAGAKPVFVDVLDSTLNIDPAAVERAITPKTKAIVAMHYAGLPCDMAALLDIGARHNLPVLEDDAHAIGTFWQGKAAGNIGVAGCFSFYANKNFTTVEGGMLTTSQDEFVARAKALRLQGMTRDAFRRDEAASWRYEIVEAGFKYPMNDVSAAIGLVQLGKLPEWQKRRARVAAHYREALAGIPGLRLPAAANEGDVHGNHLFVVRVDPDIVGRDKLGVALREAGIESSVHFVPLHLQPYFQKAWGCHEGQFPVAERAFREILSLPMHGGMADYDALLVANEIRRILTTR